MAAKRGTTLLIQRGDGELSETFETVSALRNAEVNFNGESIDVTTMDDLDVNNEIWRARITGVKDIVISADGLGKTVAGVQGITEDYLLGQITNYRVVIPYVGAFTAPFIVTNKTDNGAYDGALSFSISIESAGAPTFTAEVVPAVPTNLVLPAVIGTPQVGVALVAYRGSWTGEPTSFTYQWQENDSGWANITGATANSYTPIVGEVGNPLRVIVTAVNSAGASSPATSGPSADVLAA
jgi:TP901-1 family phage major tail protein